MQQKKKQSGTQSDPLQRLKELTPDLPSFPNETQNGHIDGCKIHKMTTGTSISWNLMNQPEVSCARWYNSNGTEFPIHVHDQREWIVVYKGSMSITIDDQEEVRLLPGMSMVINPSIKHSCRFLEDCWYLAITVPKSEDFPV